MQPNGILGIRRNCFFILRHCAHYHKTASLNRSPTISSVNEWNVVTMEPQFNEPLYNEVQRTIFFSPVIV